MPIFKVKEEYDGRLPVYHVVKEVAANNNVESSRYQIIETFDTYKEADEYCKKLVSESKVKDDRLTPCGEENPCE